MWQAHTIEANGLSLHYHRTGGDKPPMILLHGITDMGLCWEDVAHSLEADYDIIMPDVRGHGSSDIPESNDTFEPLVEDANALIQALEIEDPILFGHSLGAITSLSLAGYYPDVPRAIILEDPPPWWMPSDNDTSDAQTERVIGARDRLKSLKNKSADELVAMQRAETPHWSDNELKNWAQSKLKVSLGVPDLFGATDFTTWDWANILAQVQCPTLLITGDTDKGAIVNTVAADNLKSHIAQLQVDHITGTGHSIHRDDFDACMRAVKSFLNEIK